MLKFKCTGCGGEQLEEVMNMVTVRSEVTNVSKTDGVEYGEQENEDGEIVRYACVRCGKALVAESGDYTNIEHDCISSPAELVEYLEENGMME